jgi:hypothetical protein
MKIRRSNEKSAYFLGRTCVLPKIDLFAANQGIR